MINWKTTLCGIIAGVGIFLSQSSNEEIRRWSAIGAALGATGIGVNAKDKDVTGIGTNAHKLRNTK